MTKKKKMILIGAVLLLLVGAYEAKAMLFPAAKVKEKISGAIYILPGQFLVNLKDGRYGKLTVALVLGAGQAAAAATGAEAAAPPDGFGTLPEEAAVRDIITNVLTNQTGPTLTSATGRTGLKHKILLAIRSGTDVKVSDVLFTDVAVQ